ncbi:hypothetical protein M758_5G104200 [Ceratodon purpureus]|nr:hypothetical protein M758_5G104200 [Ceratodon purpureus]
MDSDEEEKKEQKVKVPDTSRPTCDLHDEDEEEDVEAGPPDFTTGIVMVERNVLKNGGIKKMIVSHGTDPSPKTPLYGDEIKVHYTGMLPDGTVFDSSRDKEPYVFNLGVGQVIKGWDKGVKTMRKGEQAVFTLKPEYAYGKAGRPPGVPPNTTLKFDIELLSWCSVRDVCRDGGVMKKIIFEGESWETPKDPDEVTVKYVAKLDDGTIISKSPDEGSQYIVKDGLFCSGISHAVKTMNKKEVVVLTIRPEYGFGPEGREATNCECVVPPNATLTIDLEVISWNAVESVTDDNVVIKKIIRQGESYEKPNDGSFIKVKYIGTLLDGTIFEKKGYDSEEPYTICIDEDQVVPGLDETFVSMKKNEVCIVTIPPQYGFEGEEKQCDLALVPPNSILTYEVEMVSFIKEKDHWDWNSSQKIAGATKKKEQGNNLFKSGKLFQASLKYEKGAKYVDYDIHFPDANEKKTARELKISLNLNDAACKLKLNKFPEVVDLTTKVLDLDSMNVKALFRRTQANSALMEVELAYQDIKMAVEVDPENRDVASEHKKLRQKVTELHKKEAKLYGNMFERMRKMEEKELKQPDEGLANLANAEPVQENSEKIPAQVSVQG